MEQKGVKEREKGRGAPKNTKTYQPKYQTEARMDTKTGWADGPRAAAAAVIQVRKALKAETPRLLMSAVREGIPPLRRPQQNNWKRNTSGKSSTMQDSAAASLQIIRFKKNAVTFTISEYINSVLLL